MDFHRLCLMLPEMSGEEYAGLVEDLTEFGQRRQIITYKGKILDGRHRYRALRELGSTDADIRFVEWEPRNEKDTPEASVGSELHRRNLTKAQIAMVVISLIDYAAEHGRGGRPKKNPTLSGGFPQPTVAERAAAHDVGATTLRDAARITREADPELKAAVSAGKVSIKEAITHIKNSKGGAATPPPAPAPSSAKTTKRTSEQKQTERIKGLEGELVAARGTIAGLENEVLEMADTVVTLNEELVSLQALRDNEQFALLKDLQHQLRTVERERDTGNRTREVMEAEIKRLQRVVAKLEMAK